jgi:hypothetical protein
LGQSADVTFHQELRRQAAAALQRFDENAEEEQKEFMRNMIMGCLPGGQPEFQLKYDTSITNYAWRYTAKDGSFAGMPEAFVMATCIGRPVAVIAAPTPGRENLFGVIKNSYRTRETTNVHQWVFERTSGGLFTQRRATTGK